MIAEALIISSVLAGSVYYKFSKESKEKKDIISKWNNLMRNLEKTEENEEKYKIENVGGEILAFVW